ncbi:hypothetical protein HJG43_01670 [Kineosporiaceae bacterium SCSIO 59966]|nr:hypothetical protein HJG43_01670 [Kineosporiaceae bacterium SCSIO 59966]
MLDNTGPPRRVFAVRARALTGGRAHPEVQSSGDKGEDKRDEDPQHRQRRAGSRSAHGGTMSVKQRDTDPNNNRYYWAVSSNGNSFSRKAATDGGTVSWTSVASSNYTFRTRTVSDQNCNGILPGLGNTTLAWTVTP